MVIKRILLNITKLKNNSSTVDNGLIKQLEQQ